jgi:hypothetical protein
LRIRVIYSVIWQNLSGFIVADLYTHLRPFMTTQKLVEGQAYFTINLVPYMVNKTRKASVKAIKRPTSLLFIQSITREMLYVFNSHFGQGLARTIQRIYNHGSRSVLRG